MAQNSKNEETSGPQTEETESQSCSFEEAEMAKEAGLVEKTEAT